LGDVIAVCGLSREGAVLRGAGVRVIAGGGDAARLAETLAREARGADGIISFGMAGALDPSLRIGDWVIGDGVTGAFTGPCDARWAGALVRAMPQARFGRFYADGRLIADPAEKRALGQGGALAADMESHVVARVAAEAGIPFAVLRCISDEAGQVMPPAIAVSMAPHGGLALGAVFRSIARNLGQIPDLMRSFSVFNRAYAALREGAKALGGRLAFDLR
jgi:hopanoid-associated phosphorylase